MYIVADMNPAIETQQGRDAPLPTKLWGRMADVWLCRLDRQVEHAVLRCGHAGVLEDYRQAARPV